MDRVLALLDEHRVRGTFFVLGLVAREKPDLVRRIARHGHEVASHGIGHVPLHQLDVRDMRADVVDSRKLLSDMIGQDVVGFRAPEFSIVRGVEPLRVQVRSMRGATARLATIGSPESSATDSV